MLFCFRSYVVADLLFAEHIVLLGSYANSEEKLVAIIAEEPEWGEWNNASSVMFFIICRFPMFSLVRFPLRLFLILSSFSHLLPYAEAHPALLLNSDGFKPLLIPRKPLEDWVKQDPSGERAKLTFSQRLVEALSELYELWEPAEDLKEELLKIEHEDPAVSLPQTLGNIAVVAASFRMFFLLLYIPRSYPHWFFQRHTAFTIGVLYGKKGQVLEREYFDNGMLSLPSASAPSNICGPLRAWLS